MPVSTFRIRCVSAAGVPPIERGNDLDWVEQLQKLVPWAARLPVLPKVLLSAVLSTFLLLLLALIWVLSEEKVISDSGDIGHPGNPGPHSPGNADTSHQADEGRARSVNAVGNVLRGCYTRAVFTRTHAQLSLEAMYSSIVRCQIVVESELKNVSELNLAQKLANVLGALDQIERICKRSAPDPATHLDLSDADRGKIDQQKLEVLRNLRGLSTVAKIPYAIPHVLPDEVFFTEEDANKPPTIN